MRATLAVAAAAFLYFVLFRTYGFQVEDEGTLLFALGRILDGQFPYADFHTGYTPGFFYLAAALLKLAGGAADGLRLFIALVNAASAAALYVLARRLTGPWIAAIAPALWVAFLPVYPGEFASFNVPYPAWFATAAWLLLCLVLLRFTEEGRLRDVVVAGLVAAFAFAIKPNAGAFALTAATWAVVGATRIPAALDRVLGVVATLAMALGVWFAFGLDVWSIDALFHLVPLAAVTALVCGPIAGRYAGTGHPATGRGLVVLAASFVVPSLVWIVPVLLRLGPRAFLTDVLLIGSGAAELYYEAYPAPQLYALAVVTAVAALVLGSALVRGWYLSPVTLLALAVLAAGGGAWFVAGRAVMPESVPLSISLQLENASFWLAPIVNWGGVAMLAASARRLRPVGDERRLAVLAPAAVAMYWQVYPRIDFMHVINAAPLAIVLAVWLLSRVVDWWSEGAWPSSVSGRAIVRAGVALGVAAIVALEVTPGLAALLRARAAPLAIDVPRVHARVEESAADDLAAFGDIARYLAANAEPGEAALPFPATAGLLFAAGLESPVPHDYWFPGRPAHEDEQRMLAKLTAEPPRLIVTLNDGWWYFSGAPAYFAATRAFVTENYRLSVRRGRFDVLARRDVADGLPRLSEPVPGGAMDAVYEPVRARRMQAVRRWLAAVTPAEASAAALPAQERSALLLLRGLRDAGTLRAAGWLVAGLGSPVERIRREAVDAAAAVAERAAASRLRWANDFDRAAFVPYVSPYRGAAEELAAAADEGARALGESMRYVLEVPAR